MSDEPNTNVFADEIFADKITATESIEVDEIKSNKVVITGELDAATITGDGSKLTGVLNGFTFPSVDGNSGDVLQTNGNKALSFATASSWTVHKTYNRTTPSYEVTHLDNPQVVNFVFSGLNGIFALWSEARFNWGPQQIGIMMSFVGILLAFHQAISINFFVSKLKEKRTILVSILSIFIGIYTLSISFNYLFLSIAIFFCTMGIGILNPTINSLISLNSQNKDRGSALSINQSGLSIARFTGQPFAGFFFQSLSINAPLYIGLFVLLLVKVIYFKKLFRD